MARPLAVEFASICTLVLIQLLTTHATFVTPRASEPNPDISSGTCYYASGKEADSSYIPCGNTAFGVFSCCEAGSFCLDHNACFSSDGVTYLAGCTDPTYSDPSCPHKIPYADQQWTGLVYCNGTSNEWTLCDDAPSGSVTVTLWPGCYCPEQESLRNVAFDAPSVLAGYLSLPASIGGSMSFANGYTPNTVLTSSVISTSAQLSSASSTSTSTPITASSPTPAQSSAAAAATSSTSVSPSRQPQGGLSTSDKIGIGVGAGVGGLLTLAVIGAMALYIRRLKKRQFNHDPAATWPISEMPVVDKELYDGFSQRTPLWSGNMSELAGSDSRDLSLRVSPESTQPAWSRPMSTDIEGSVPKNRSTGTLRSSELSDGNTISRASRGVQEMPTGTPEAPSSSVLTKASYWPGRHDRGGVYEMPAHLPGSSFLDR